VQPKVLVALGATAAQALLGRQFRVTKQRGVPVDSDLAPYVVATVHPSSILRQETEDDRAAAMKDFVADLKVVAKLLRA
jgi:DNA polymerase